MDVVKLPKKARMVCYEIMDGKEGALDTLESFSDKYPHQVAAVKAEVAYFNLDYEKALALDLTILPWLEEWYYSNAVSYTHLDVYKRQHWMRVRMASPSRRTRSCVVRSYSALVCSGRTPFSAACRTRCV